MTPFSTSSRRHLTYCISHLILLQLASALKDCKYNLEPLWSSSLRNAPLTATPLLFDVDGDGYKDIVAPSFKGEVWAIHGESGHIVDNWPFYLEDRSFHSTPLVYDVNGDGILEFLLTTSDAELVFIQTDNTLLHGETIKIPPLRMKRLWFELDHIYLQKLAEDLSKQMGTDKSQLSPESSKKPLTNREPLNFSTPYSEFESRFGRYSDPLYSRHQPDKRVSGLDPSDEDYVFVDPHVLATPTLADTDGDGFDNQLVIPVSYYFDPYYYGDKSRLALLGGLEGDELKNYVASGIVIMDLNSGRVISQKFLGITQVSSPQPGYMLATPTVVRNTIGEDGKTVIIVGSATGELHMLDAKTLTDEPGFPVSLDSITGQVAVADLLDNGELEMVIGDNSGNVYCIDRRGRTVWERETGDPFMGSARFADLEGDGIMEVVFTTQMGNLWILNGKTGEPFPNYPLHLNVPVQASVMLMHLNSLARQNALSIVLPFAGGLYIVDALTGCVDKTESEHMFLETLSEDIDPYHPGLEILSASVDGGLVCFSTGNRPASDYEQAVESWPGEAIGQNGFTHRSNSFAVVLPHTNDTVRDISGRSFTLNFELHHNGRQQSSKQYTILVTIGRKHVLYSSTLAVHLKQNVYSLTIPTPSTPTHAFLTLKLCNDYHQCESVSYNVKFNLHFEENLQWFLCLPFLLLCGSLLWLHREAGSTTLLPTTSALTSSRKDL